jgi:Thermolysin metallopeptidase, alpha-helical domain
MRSCPHCKAQIPNDAARCQFCTSWLDGIKEPEKASSNSVVYIVDKDLLRFAKFSGSVLGVMIIVGSVLFGIDLKTTQKDTRSIRDEVAKDRDDIRTSVAQFKNLKQEVETLQSAVNASSEEVKAKVKEIQEGSQTVRGIVTQISSAKDMPTLIKITVRDEITRHFYRVLTPDQVASLKESLSQDASAGAMPTRKIYTPKELRELVERDIRETVAFFKKHGLDMKVPPVKVVEETSFMNAAWDGNQVLFGLGMVNSDIFDSYSPTIAFHETTHALIPISFSGQSGSVSESLCDTIAAIMTRQWTIGSMRTANGRAQVLRSLKAPGQAYDDPAFGKDPQVDHMMSLKATSNDLFNDGNALHINLGILNKAVFLMTEGGDHRGQVVKRGIGWEKTEKLYVEVIKRIRDGKSQSIDFAAFKSLVVATAKEVLPLGEDRIAVADAFRAVGL